MPKNRTPEIEALIGAKIREVRLRREITQEGLAEKLGLTFQQIQKYEGGKNRVAASTLMTMAEALDVPLTDLLPEQGGAAEALAPLDPQHAANAAKIAVALSKMPHRWASAVMTLVSALAKDEENANGGE